MIKIELLYQTKILISIIGNKMKLRIISLKYAVDSAIKFRAKLILRPMVFTETTRNVVVKKQGFLKS